MFADQALQPQSVCGIYGFLLAETQAFSGMEVRVSSAEADETMEGFGRCKIEIRFLRYLD